LTLPVPGLPHATRRRLVALAAAGALVAAPGVARADAEPPALVLSRYETAVAGRNINRDGGYSVVIPGSGQAVWFFGDAFWNDGGFLLGSTSAIGPAVRGRVPTELSEIPTPPAAVEVPNVRAPQRFLPVPDGLVAPDGTSCLGRVGSAPASWPTGAALIPGTYNVLVTYLDVCLTLPRTMVVQRFGVAEYDPLHNRIVAQHTVFDASRLAELPFPLALGSPVFAADGYLHLYGSTCDDTANSSGVCVSGRVTATRVPARPADWRAAGSYQFWTGTAWTADWSQVRTVLPDARPAGLVHVAGTGELGKGLVMVEQLDLLGGYRVWRSDSFTGGWSPVASGFAPCSHGENQVDMCRTYAAHPDISTSSRLLMSYFDPGQSHVGVIAVPW
jgi:hypothetical protein